MTTELTKQYQPKEAQARWFKFWEDNGFFNADPNPNKKPHTIMIPLPNVTGALHMGHALNGTLQDLITRYRRMQGYEALWMPGTDHAGIATQAVVERRMFEEEGLTRHDVGRDALVRRIWRWKDTYEQRILNQLKGIGASCDWRRVRFTLDEVCSKAVRRTFFQFFKDGLIYRGKRLVNWDTFLQTAVADDEVFHEEVDGHFWTFRYPVVDGGSEVSDAGLGPLGRTGRMGLGEGDEHLRPSGPSSPIVFTGEFIQFSTTRPETMLGDTAVCVHPTDERYQHLIGKQVQIPLNGRLIPIIADALLAKKELGTGCVKVTPAHDPNDYACGLRNGLPMINILNPNGTLNENGGKFEGLDRYEARKQVVAAMESLGHFLKVEDRKIELAHSDRSKTAVEPYLSAQWFVKMTDHDDGRPGLAQTAMNAVTEKRVRFFPSRYTSTYMDWLGEKRDWCISRQLWWGHRIPVWSKKIDSREQGLASLAAWGATTTSGDSIAIGAAHADYLSACFAEGKTADELLLLACIDAGHDNVEKQLTDAGFAQDEDVLDTWFSSALWPHATLGWPDREHNPPIQLPKNVELIPAERISLDKAAIDPNMVHLLPLEVMRENNAVVIGEENGMVELVFADRVERPVFDKLQFLLDREISPYVADAVEVADLIRSLPKPDESVSEVLYEWTGTNEVLPYFYPGNVLITSRDIITLWVARMVLTGLYNMGDVPFQHVHVHPKILDGFGQTMSKSKGNGCDPIDLIDRYGTDAIRFTIASFAGETQDVRLPMAYECPHCQTLVPQVLDDDGVMVKPATLKTKLRGSSDKPRLTCPNAKCKKQSQFSTPQYEADPGEPVAKMVSERFEYGRNFCNKFWNAARFAIMNLEGFTPGSFTEADLRLEDRWILSRLSKTVAEVTALLDRYQFDQATRALRDFTWNEFCDWYLEMIKPRLRSTSDVAESLRDSAAELRSNSATTKQIAQRVLIGVLDTLIRALQPFAPFICEELWQRLNEIAPTRGLFEPMAAAKSVMIAPWPSLQSSLQDEKLEARFNRLQETVIAVRNIRAVYNISPAEPIKLHLKCTSGVASEMTDCADQFDNLAKAVLAAAGAEVERPTASASFTLSDADGYVPLEGLIDVKAEYERQIKEAEKIRNFIRGHEAKLSNESFVARAPEAVVAQTREALAGLQKQLESVELVIAQLGPK